MKCTKDRCRADAVCVPVLRVPAKGVAIAQHTPMSMLLDIPLCPAHMASAKANDFVIEETREMVRTSTKGLRLVEPDFSRMYLERADIGGELYNQLKSMGSTKH